MPTTTNYGWTTPADTDLVKDGAAAIRTLGSSIDTTVFNNANAAIAKTIVDAKGDIIAATAADTVARLASSGNNGDLLTVDTSTATGLKWAAPAASGGMTLIQETVANANSSLSFTSIPQTYKNLVLTWSGIYYSATSNIFNIRLNNDSTQIYRNRFSANVNGTFTSAGDNDADKIANTGAYSPFGRDTTQTEFYNRAMGFLQIENYASTSKVKNITGEWSTVYTGVGTHHILSYIGAFDTTTAVSSIDIYRQSGTGTFSNMANTSIRLYGVS